MPRIQALTATPANMRHAPQGAFALDRFTGETWSADANDYWQMADHEPLTNADGRVLILARRESRIVSIVD